MTKIDRFIVAILVLLLCLSFWQTKQYQDAQQTYLAEHPELMAPPAAATNEVATALSGDTAMQAAAGEAEAIAEAEPVSTLPETTAVLSNDLVQVTLTSKGGAVRDAVLSEYFRTRNPEDGPVAFDFSDAPSLSYEGLTGFGKRADFVLSEATPTTAVYTATAPSGLVLTRRYSLNGYRVTVRDTFENPTAAPIEKPAFGVVLGALDSMAASTNGVPDFGIDLRTVFPDGKGETLEQNLSTGFDKNHPSFAAMYGASGGGCSAVRLPISAPVTAKASIPAPAEWAAIRDRFFVTILTPGLQNRPTAFETRLSRDAMVNDGSLTLETVGAAFRFEAETIAPGADATFDAVLYVGPRKLSELRAMGPAYVDVMRFGTWGLFCRWLLDLLNFIHRFIPNYGWAIIVMTFLVRLVLLPLNRKSAESMRKMAEIQPLIKELQARYKDDPKKLQQEQMALFQKHKVNPMSGCLPMLVQLPIFIALFTVLRSCVELRYAGFLWIADLSEPENLFRETLGFPINILPITMAITMTLQSRLMPSASDPSQQRMMTIIMPIMMLLMCYSFPSALGLYWTVSQGLGILGMAWARRRGKKQVSGGSFTQADGTEVIPPRETRQMRRERERNAAN